MSHARAIQLEPVPGRTARQSGSSWDPAADAEVLRALASPWRLKMVCLLAAEDLDVTTLAGRLGMSVANASQHLVRLRAAGVVACRQEGTRRVFSLVSQQAREVWLLLSASRA